ncbi:MAG: CRTAC1 family protein [Acidobacteriota bacterium]
MITSPVRQRMTWVVATVTMVWSLVAVSKLDKAASGVGAAGESTALVHGFRLTESAAALGMTFTHQPAEFDAQLAPIMPQIASTGAAVSIVDFNRDGWQDVYVTNSAVGSPNHLYRNNGNGTFSDVAATLGVADVNRDGTGTSTGAVWGDYDNDGFEDLFLYKYGRPELFHNDGGQRFTAVTDRAGLPPWVNANSAIWWDYDRDGRLDLLLAGYWSEDVDLWHLKTTKIMPESFEYAENGGRKYVLHNQGDGTFADTTAALGIESRRWTLAVAAGDLFGSGYPDLFFANDYGIPQLYRNDGGRKFVEVGRESGIALTPKSGMNASFGDVFNDGRLSIYKTNISEPGVLVQANDLWVPKTGAAGFENLAASLGVDLGGWSWGAQFGDLNNDGRLDLYLTNGYISAGDRTSYWYDFAQIAVGHSRIISDAKNWPAMRGRSLSGYQRKHLWINDGAGHFNDVAQSVGVTDTYDGRAVALADLTNQGVLDVLVANQGGPLLVYRNTVAPGRHWIAFDLEGTASNRSGIGARVELRWKGQRQVQEVSGGSGFSAQNQRRLHFGLGAASDVDAVVIRWPSGRVQTIEHPPIDGVQRVTEPRS